MNDVIGAGGDNSSGTRSRNRVVRSQGPPQSKINEWYLSLLPGPQGVTGTSLDAAWSVKSSRILGE